MEVEKLFEYITEETKKYVEMIETLGSDHPMARKYCAQICGMQKAFSVIAGISYTEYLINSIA